ncbi:hypothetical protein FACS1894102_0840 [Spirochaetia bacterium]|nr:hypothetical protein FACS1894102_0840 [Spirochaetia bacterium]
MTKFERINMENVPPYSVMICIVLAAMFFFARAPIIIVSDELFTAVYGAKREHYRYIEMTARLFRQVKIVRMAIDAQPDTVAFAIKDASKRPHFVVFPYRYISALQIYTQNTPKIKCFVLSDYITSKIYNNAKTDTAGAQLINTGIGIDYYRAGLCTGIISKLKIKDAEGKKINDINNTVLYFPSGDQNLDESFYQGVKKISSGSAIIDFQKDVTDLSKTYKSTVLLQSATNEYMRSNNKFDTKLIVRSWIDPEYTPPNTVAVFDDSPIMLLPKIAKLRYKKISEDPIEIPCEINFMFTRIDDIKILLSLVQVVMAR